MSTNTNTSPRGSESNSRTSNRSQSWSTFSPNSNPYQYPLPPPSDPPPYTPSESTTNTIIHGLQIPSYADNFTSGFAYPPLLHSYDITRTHWTQFTTELALPVKLTRGQWATTVAKGLGTLAVGASMAGVLGVVPAVLVARKARRNREERNLIVAATAAEQEQKRQDGGEGGDRENGDGKTGALVRTLQTWNQMFFEPHGLRVSVQGPWEGVEEMEEMEVSRVGGKKRVKEKRAREDAARKARIVIVPVGL